MNKILAAVALLAIGLVVFLGLYLVVKGARHLQLAAASTHWPTTPGTVISSDTTRDVTPSTDDDDESVTFNTRTVIQYTVNGQQYTTDVLHFGQTLGSGDKSAAVLLGLRYPKGKGVTVSYDPGNPSTAVMKPGVHAEAFWLPGAGLAFLLPAVLCLIMGPTMMRSFSPSPNDLAFQNSVRAAMEAASRGEVPPDPIPPPPSQSGGAMALCAALFGALLCGLGILALTAGFQRIWRGAASESWPTTQGVVIVANKGGGENGEDAVDDSTDQTSYARFVYQYEVAGTKHFNNLRRFAGVEGGSREEADRIASRYRKNASVKVSYFPADPDVSVLEPGNTGDSLWLPGIGVVLILFSLAIFIWMVPALAK